MQSGCSIKLALTTFDAVFLCSLCLFFLETIADRQHEWDCAACVCKSKRLYYRLVYTVDYTIQTIIIQSIQTIYCTVCTKWIYTSTSTECTIAATNASGSGSVLFRKTWHTKTTSAEATLTALCSGATCFTYLPSSANIPWLTSWFMHVICHCCLALDANDSVQLVSQHGPTAVSGSLPSVPSSMDCCLCPVGYHARHKFCPRSRWVSLPIRSGKAIRKTH